MGFCFSAGRDGSFPECKGNLNASKHTELPCGGMGGGADDMTHTCPSFCHTLKEAKGVREDWDKQMGWVV